jgi:paraquat-inducible protein B
MKFEANPKIVGAFVLGAVVLVVIVFVVFGSARLFSEKYSYVVYFRGSVNGLQVGSPVKLEGVQVGYVTNITPVFDRNGMLYVEVIVENYTDVIKGIGINLQKMSHQERLDFLVQRGLRAQLSVESLVLGQLYVKLDFFPGTPVVRTGFNKKYLEIPATPTPREEIEQTLTRTLNEISTIPFKEISGKLLSALSGVDTLVKSSDLKESIIALKNTMDQAETMLTDFNVRSGQMMASVQQSARQMDSTLADLSVFIKKMDQFTGQNRYELYSAIRELSLAARSFRNLAEYLEQHPNDLIFGKD